MGAVVRWFTAPVPRARVAAFRVVIYAFVIWDVRKALNDVIPHSAIPELYQPTLLARLVRLPPFSFGVAEALLVAVTAFCILALLNVAPRLAGWGVTVTFWTWALNSQGFSYVQHDHLALMVATLVLPTVGVARHRDTTPSEQAGWALRCVQIATVLTYFGSLYSKWHRSGSLVRWANSAVLTWAITRRGSESVRWTLDHPWVLRVAQWAALVMEGLSPLVLFLKGRWLYLAAAVFGSFHLLTYIALEIHFLPTVVCWLAFFPLERVSAAVIALADRAREAVGGRARADASPPLG